MKEPYYVDKYILQLRVQTETFLTNVKMKERIQIGIRIRTDSSSELLRLHQRIRQATRNRDR